MRYVVDDPEGRRLAGVKELGDFEAGRFRAHGYTLWPFDDGAWMCAHGHMFCYQSPPAYPPWCGADIKCRAGDFRWIIKDEVTSRDWLPERGENVQ